jgi:hypothetical protein
VIIGIARLGRDYPRLPVSVLLVSCILQSWLLMLGPLLLLEGRWMFWPALWGLGPLAVAGLLFCWLQPGLDDCPTDTSRWIRQALLAGGASVLGLWML